MTKKKDQEQPKEESRFLAKNREKKVSVTVGGTAFTESGKLTRSNYFRWIGHDLDQYDMIKMTPEEARSIDTHLRKLSTGSTAMVPMYCAGPSCPFADRCPLQKMDKAPIAKQCLIENQLLKEFTLRYFNEFDVDPNNFTEVGYITELAEILILEMRLNMALARPENAELVIDQVANVTSDGTPIIQKQLSPFMEQKERLATRRSRIIKLMVGDRQEKYKKEAALKVKIDADPSSRMARMRSQLEKLQRQLDNLGTELPDPGGEKQDEGYLSPEDVINASLEDGES